MAWLDWLRRKSLPAPGSSMLLLTPGSGDSVRNLEAYFTEGYGQNPIVYACISVIAKNAASVKLEVVQGEKVLTGHPLLDLLAKPNPTQTGKEFFKELITFHQAAGEAFILRLPAKGKAVELYNLDPRYVEVETAKDGGPVPLAYLYGTGEKKKRYPVNPLDGESQVKHIRGPNLASIWRGMSPMSPAAVATDIHNAGGRWNKSLLENSARPSGIIEITGAVPDGTIAQLKAHFHKAWQGVVNAGSVPVLTGGAKFTPLSHTPKDMDFSTGMTEAAKNIALVYGVPLPLVTTEAATFANMDAALERLWSDTVLPLLDEVVEALSDFLAPAFGKDLKLTYNADSVPALEGKRARKFDRMVKGVAGGIITPDEARLELGFDEIGGKAAELFMPGSMKPIDEPDELPGELAKSLRAAGFSAAEVKAELEKEFGESLESV